VEFAMTSSSGAAGLRRVDRLARAVSSEWLTRARTRRMTTQPGRAVSLKR
jgi:hypothetical protein